MYSVLRADRRTSGDFQNLSTWLLQIVHVCRSRRTPESPAPAPPVASTRNRVCGQVAPCRGRSWPAPAEHSTEVRAVVEFSLHELSFVVREHNAWMLEEIYAICEDRVEAYRLRWHFSVAIRIRISYVSVDSLSRKSRTTKKIRKYWIEITARHSEEEAVESKPGENFLSRDE